MRLWRITAQQQRSGACRQLLWGLTSQQHGAALLHVGWELHPAGRKAHDQALPQVAGQAVPCLGCRGDGGRGAVSRQCCKCSAELLAGLAPC